MSAPLVMAVLCLAADSSFAAQATGPSAAKEVFVSRYLKAVSLALDSRPFYASKLLNSLDLHIREVASRPRDAGGYLKGEIVGSGRSEIPVARFNAELGRKPLEDANASALLLANALSRPDQFQEVLSGLETLAPGLGRRVTESLKSAGEIAGADYRAVASLRRLGETIKPHPEGLTYDSKGKLDLFFDGHIRSAGNH